MVNKFKNENARTRYSKLDASRRYRFWVFTSFIDPNKDLLQKLIDKEILRYVIYQREKTPTTGKIHWQGFSQWHKPVYLKQIKEMFKNNALHLEPMYSKPEDNIAYCSKLKSKDGETVELGRPTEQGRRSDLESLYDDIESGATLKQILKTHKGNALRHINVVYKASQIVWNQDRFAEYQDEISKWMNAPKSERTKKQKKDIDFHAHKSESNTESDGDSDSEGSLTFVERAILRRDTAQMALKYHAIMENPDISCEALEALKPIPPKEVKERKPYKEFVFSSSDDDDDSEREYSDSSTDCRSVSSDDD